MLFSLKILKYEVTIIFINRYFRETSYLYYLGLPWITNVICHQYDSISYCFIIKAEIPLFSLFSTMVRYEHPRFF